MEAASDLTRVHTALGAASAAARTRGLVPLAIVLLYLALLSAGSAHAQVTSCLGQPNGTPCVSNDNGCWTVGSCAFNVCVGSIPEAPGTSCNDGLFCNGADTCDGVGTCVSPGDPCPGPDGDVDCSESCNEATDSCTAFDPDETPCDASTECTQSGVCGVGTCLFLNEPNGTPCTNDGAFCNGAEECQSGACVSPGDPCAGPDGDLDCSESCNETTDSCTAPDPNGSSCDDGVECTSGDTCSAGACAGLEEPDGTPCTSDGTFCNGAEECQAGSCVAPGDPCLGPDGDGDCSESCDETSDSCTAPDPDGSACDDADVCTTVNACAGGACAGSVPLDCDDGNPCTAEACDAVTGCSHTPIPGCYADSGCVSSTDAQIHALIDTLKTAGEAIVIDGSDADWSPFPSFPDATDDLPDNPGQEIVAGAIAPLADRIRIFARTAGAPPTTAGVLDDGTFAVSLEMLGSPSIDAQIVLSPQSGVHPVILFDARNNPILPPSRFITDPALEIAVGADFIEVDVPYSALIPLGKPLDGLPGTRKWARGAIVSLHPSGAVLDLGPGASSYRLLTTPFTLDEPLFAVSPPNPPLSMALPVRDQWFVTQGADGSVTHQGYFAFDLNQVDSSFSFSSPPGSSVNGHYFAFGQPLFAPLSGTVTEAVGVYPDQTPPMPPDGSPPSNIVRIDAGAGLSVATLHLKQNSLLVEASDPIAAGNRFARVGNSGFSDVPHLHVEVNEAAGPLGASIRGAELTNVRISLNPGPNDPWSRECAAWEPREGFLVESLNPPAIPALGLAGGAALTLILLGGGWLLGRRRPDLRT